MNPLMQLQQALVQLVDGQGVPDPERISQRMRHRWRGLGYSEEAIKERATDLARELGHLIAAPTSNVAAKREG